MDEEYTSIQRQGTLFTYKGKSLGTLGELWTCTLLERSLFLSPALIHGDIIKQAEGNLSKSKAKTLYFTEYLVPDEDFEVLHKERVFLYREHEAQKFSFNYLPIYKEPLSHPPIDIRLAGQSVSDFLTLFRLEQYEGVYGYGKLFAEEIQKFLMHIPSDAFEEYELEWKLKDAAHEFNSPLLKIVLKEIKATFLVEDEIQQKGKKDEILPVKKQRIKLRLELESFLMHQKTALIQLVEGLEHIRDKNEEISHLLGCARCTLSLYELILHQENIPNWPKVTLLANFLEGSGAADSWTTFPMKRRYFAPFLLRCAFEEIKRKFSNEEVLQAIFDFDKIAYDLSVSCLQGKEIEARSKPIAALQEAFYQNATLFSAHLNLYRKDEKVVYDQGTLLLLPTTIQEKNLITWDEERNQLVPTEEALALLNF